MSSRPSAQTVHVGLLGLLHGVEVVDGLHVLHELAVQPREHHLHALVAQLLHVQRQLQQRLLVDDLRVAEAQQQGDLHRFYVLLHQPVDLLRVVEVVQVAHRPREPVQHVRGALRRLRLVALDGHHLVHEGAGEGDALFLLLAVLGAHLRDGLAVALALPDVLEHDLGGGLLHEAADVVDGDEGGQDERDDGVGQHVQGRQHRDEDDVAGVDAQHVAQEVDGRQGDYHEQHEQGHHLVQELQHRVEQVADGHLHQPHQLGALEPRLDVEGEVLVGGEQVDADGQPPEAPRDGVGEGQHARLRLDVAQVALPEVAPAPPRELLQVQELLKDEHGRHDQRRGDEHDDLFQTGRDHVLGLDDVEVAVDPGELAQVAVVHEDVLDVDHHAQHHEDRDERDRVQPVPQQEQDHDRHDRQPQGQHVEGGERFADDLQGAGQGTRVGCVEEGLDVLDGEGEELYQGRSTLTRAIRATPKTMLACTRPGKLSKMAPTEWITFQKGKMMKPLMATMQVSSLRVQQGSSIFRQSTPRIEMPQMVMCEEDRKKHTTEDIIIEMNPADSSLKVRNEYVIDIVWVSREIDAIRVRLRQIFDHADSCPYMFSYIALLYSNHQLFKKGRDFLLQMRRQVSIAPYGTLWLQELIGKGSYGQIYKAYSSAQQKHYAIKIISSDSDSDSLVNIEREIKILMSCNHPHIVKCHSVEIIDEMVWIVMDYYSRGSLADIMAKAKLTFSQGHIRTMMGQILDALAYLHDKNIIHRDIKAANILVDDNGDVKVADFGVSTLVSQSHRHTRTGSPLWMSPELLSNSNYSFKTDIWSLGITALELAEGVPPYSHQHPYRAIFSIQAHPPKSLSEPQKWSPQFNSFVSKCLTLDQNKRPSAKDMRKHEFIARPSPALEVKQVDQTKQCLNAGQSTGTMILHSSFDQSVWQKNGCLPTNENMNESNISSDTFKMRAPKPKEKGMALSLLAQITKAMPVEKGEEKENEDVEQLYHLMEEEIKNVRRKYLARIKAIEEKSMLTFQQQLRKPKQSAS